MHRLHRRATSIAGFALAAFVLLAIDVPAASPAPATQWYTVLLDGRKIGSFTTTRADGDGRVVTTQRLSLTFDRGGTPIALESSETDTETADGKPLGFDSTSRLSGTETTIAATIDGTVMHLSTRDAGGERTRELPWPAGALLTEGQRLAAIHAGLAPGTRYRVLAFQAANLTAMPIDNTVGRPADVELPEGTKRLSPIDQVIGAGAARVVTRAWVDASQTVYRMTLPLFGVDLTLLACDEACATAPTQGADLFAHTIVASPRPLSPVERAGEVRYTLETTGSGPPLRLPDTGNQVARGDGRTIVVDVDLRGGAPDSPPPVAEDRQPNDWLQSTAPEIIALARRGAGAAADPRQRMQNLERFVRGYIRDKDLDVGYASALEVARKPEGDCTEHAVLLAALGRAVGIPTRVVDGVAYVPSFAGRTDVFVPHAWVEAWVDGGWRGFDAALNGFDAGHIALGEGDGDPWRFYQGIDSLGRFRVTQADRIPQSP